MPTDSLGWTIVFGGALIVIVAIGLVSLEIAVARRRLRDR